MSAIPSEKELVDICHLQFLFQYKIFIVKKHYHVAFSASREKMLMMSLIVLVLTLTCSLQMKQCEDQLNIIEQCNRNLEHQQ